MVKKKLTPDEFRTYGGIFTNLILNIADFIIKKRLERLERKQNKKYFLGGKK